MKDNQASFGGGESIFFLSGIMEETIRLLLEAREYFGNRGHAEHGKLAPPLRLIYAGEMTRVTMRLSCVMAWLMAQKAVAEGQMPRRLALESHRLDCADICLTSSVGAEALSPSMRLLSDKSRRLYSRVHRLDGQMAIAAGQ